MTAAERPGASADEPASMNMGPRLLPVRAVPPNGRGFTLLELLIVCAVVAIMLMFAIPAYQSYLQRVYRGTAIEVLLAAAACQERIHARDFSYDTNRCLPLPGKDDMYAFGFEPDHQAAVSSYVVIAWPLNTHPRDLCGGLMLDQDGTRSITGPVERLRKCWEGR